MGKGNRIRSPSRVDALPFPVFGLTWYGSPCALNGSTNVGNVGGNAKFAGGCSVVAYCGGGGSAKTGVGNKIVIYVATEDDATDVRTIEINTGEQLCFGVHAFRPHDDRWNMVRLLAAVGDDLYLYGIPLVTPSGDEENFSEVMLLSKTHVGKGYGCNVVGYTPLNHAVAVGCENGLVVVYHLQESQTPTPSPEIAVHFQKVVECKGHTKAVCAMAFHPRGREVLSSAKDGTARLFSVESGSCLGVLQCEVHDPNGPPPKKVESPKVGPGGRRLDPRMMKRAPQILVRGCAFGDLEGKIIYTVASGKRGPAYLTKWKALVPLRNVSQPPQNASHSSPMQRPMPNQVSPPLSPLHPPQPSPQPAMPAISFRQEFRVQCSPVPISATSLSSDASILAMGSVEGSILLYHLETNKVLQCFEGVHDLPVTCLAARPIPSSLALPGEEEEGVSFDALSASADNRLGRWTLQKRSRKNPTSTTSSRKQSVFSKWMWSVFRLPLLLLMGLMALAMRDTYELCGDMVFGPALLKDVGSAKECVYRQVLWAEESRPGILFVPE